MVLSSGFCNINVLLVFSYFPDFSPPCLASLSSLALKDGLNTDNIYWMLMVHRNNRIPSHRELKASGVWQVFREGSGPQFLLPLPAWASAKAATIPQTGWLNQQEFTLSQFWKLEVRDQGMILSLAYRRLSSCSCSILPLCPNLFFCVLIPFSCNWEQGYLPDGKAAKSRCQWARLLGIKLCTHTIHVLKSWSPIPRNVTVFGESL